MIIITINQTIILISETMNDAKQCIANTPASCEYVNCYNCTCINIKFNCGTPLFGCVLCKKYGNMEGLLLKSFSEQIIKFEDNGISYIFEPPKYSCMHCKDTKIIETAYSDGDIMQSSLCNLFTDINNPFNFLQCSELPCHKCLPEEYKLIAKKELYNYEEKKKLENRYSDQQIRYVDCYNCKKVNIKYINGNIQPGCLLCETYGDAKGNLLIEFSKTTQKIDSCGTICKFTPPINCDFCKDKIILRYQIWDEKIVKKFMNPERLMKIIEISCHKCKTTQHNIDFKRELAIYNKEMY